MQIDDPDRITGISRFGRLRKISTKLIDLPKRSPHTASKKKKCSPSLHKSKPDPFVDFRPETFKLLVSEETDSSSSFGTTDTSSSDDGYDEREVKQHVQEKD